MKRKIIALSLALITAFSLAACQATPEQEFVVQKDTERMIEQARDEEHGTTAAELGVPEENYTFSATGADGRLTVNADTPIIAPASGKLPMVSVSAGGFSQETVTGIFNYLYPNEKPLNSDPNSVLTKAAIEENILMLKKQLTDKSYDTQEFTDADIEAKITALEEAYTTAPETSDEATVSNGTMSLQDIRGNDAYCLDVYDDTSYMNVVSQKISDFSFLIYSKNGKSYNTATAIQLDNVSIPEAVNGKLMLSYESAKKLCDDMLAAGGLHNIVLGDAFIVNDSQDGNVDNKVSAAENYAYLFWYTREIDGTPIAINYQEGSNNDESYSLPWQYESITVTVDNDGIANISWTAPIEIGEVITDDAALIPYESAIDVFEKMIITKYEQSIPEGEKRTLTISDIKLCLLRVRTQNANGLEGVLTPAWVFYGKNDDWSAKNTLLAINAVDGSIIDTLIGY